MIGARGQLHKLCPKERKPVTDGFPQKPQTLTHSSETLPQGWHCLPVLTRAGQTATADGPGDAYHQHGLESAPAAGHVLKVVWLLEILQGGSRPGKVFATQCWS